MASPAQPAQPAARTNSEWDGMIKLKLGRVISDNTKPLTALSLLSGPDQQVAQAIDHTLLAPDATPDQIEAVCDEALKHGFKVRAGSCSIADRGWLMRGYRRSACTDGTSREWRSG